ncbi:hypothetical protein BFR04_06560 [Gaetbulibacter sp. 4G1]|nr:hypothetical protein [Gaetbulibacter sp. 4G1]PIA79177.1 hypothetical protein BFR04_06560 [Gaetbulibacter sp. 4G1]
MKTIKLLIILLVFNTNSIIAQNFAVDAQTIKSLNKTGLDFERIGESFIYINSESKEVKKLICLVKLELLKSKMGEFIDDELPEGGYDFKFIEENTSAIWECKSEGAFVNQKGLYCFIANSICENIERELIPGGDMFIPGGDMFVPGGDTFVPGGDTFSKEDESYYFLKMSFEGEQEIEPAILTLKIK